MTRTFRIPRRRPFQRGRYLTIRENPPLVVRVVEQLGASGLVLVHTGTELVRLPRVALEGRGV